MDESEQKEVTAIPLKRLPIALLFGVFGFILVFLPCNHMCNLGIKWLERVAPFVVFILCQIPILTNEKYSKGIIRSLQISFFMFLLCLIYVTVIHL